VINPVQVLLFVAVHDREALAPAQVITFGLFQVLPHHLGDEILQRGFGCPAQFFTRLAGITEQAIHLGWAKVLRVDLDQYLFEFE